MVIKKLKYLVDYFKYLSNPFQALLFKFRISNETVIKVKKTNDEIIIKNISSLNRLMNRLPLVDKANMKEFLIYIKNIDDDEEILSIRGINFYNIYGSEFNKGGGDEIYCHLDEFFTDDVLDIIDYSNRHVIDIGGNIGDTPLFFAKSGAEVISFEPVKHLHDIAVENVKLNNDLEKRIILVNKGIGGKRGILSIDSSSVVEYVGGDSHIMEIITFDDLFEEYEFSPDILKMDCEGCEFEIILNNDLSMFQEIILEHHQQIANKDHTLLIKELKKQGFNIKLFNSVGVDCDFEQQGMIYAYK